MWIFSRVLSSLAVLLAVSALLFALCRATPVSPARLVLGADASAQQVAEFEQQYGLDRPVLAQYGHWLRGAATLNMGESYVSGESIVAQIRRTLPVTVELVTLSFLVTVLAATLFGVAAALHEEGVVDHALRVVAIVGLSIPGFWLALLLVRAFAVDLAWFPAGGLVPLSEGVGAHLRSLVLPVASISFYYIAVLSRLVRANMIETLSQDYVRTARAMGLRPLRVTAYAVKNALPPLASMAAMVYGYMFGWALIVEQVFSLPGVSRDLLAAIFSRDYPTVQAIVLVITVIFVGSNTLADILQRALSPRLFGQH
ncbi:MAG TPA: ABC transporter permease [Burkholderiaceae bacterium]|nr:ABC transporter permease [Burkholderiaceae bacterium]